MKKLTTLILIILSTTILFAQYDEPCLPEGITFTSQAQIDNFQTNYPGCTEIEGNVYIAGANITNLNGLNTVTSIGGYLGIKNNQVLTNLTGLENLTSIGGNFRINYNQVLTNLTGLENLTSIGGNFVIDNNDALTSLTGLEGLTTINGWLDIGFISEDDLVGNPLLASITGLENLTIVGGHLSIVVNNTLPSLAGLESLTSIGGDLFIYGNETLSSLAGLESLTSIGGNLFIYYNETLSSLSGLDNIEAASITNLYIYYNSSLSTCHVQSICDYLASPNGNTEIFENAPGCNDFVEVLEACWIVHIEEGQATENQFIFYPNPVSANAKLSGEFASSKTINIYIYNTTGLCLKSWEFKNQQSGTQEFSLNLSNLPPGIYFLRLQAGNEVVTKKVVKL